jgi:hypothetical protein
VIGAGKVIPPPPLASAWLIPASPSEPSARTTTSDVSRGGAVVTTAGPISGRSCRPPATPSSPTIPATAANSSQPGATNRVMPTPAGRDERAADVAEQLEAIRAELREVNSRLSAIESRGDAGTSTD